MEDTKHRICVLTILVVVLSLCIATSKACSISPPMVVCKKEGCEIFNSQGRWEDRANCTASRAFFPKIESQLRSSVAWAVQRNKKLRVITGLAHSRPPLMCVEDEGVVISTRFMNSYLKVDVKARTITVDSGVMMRDLQDEVAKYGLALPASTSWDGVTMAGSISTGSHGSGLVGRGSSIGDYVVGMRIVVPASASEGYAKVIVLTEGDEDIKAARLSLGVLGAISQVTFALEPQFKRAFTTTIEDDEGLEARIEDFVRGSEFGIIYWYAGQGKALMQRIDRVGVEVPGEGFNNGWTATTVLKAEDNLETYEMIDEQQDDDRLCNLTQRSMNSRVAEGAGFLDKNGNFAGYPIVGFNHKMVTGGSCEDYHQTRDNETACLPDKILDQEQSICAWDRRVELRMTWDLEFRVEGAGFLDKNGNFTGYPIVGFNPKMVTGGSCEDYHQTRDNEMACLPDKILDQEQSICAWDRRVELRMTWDLEFRVPLRVAKDVMVDIKKIRALKPEALCGVENAGIGLRTLKKSNSYLGPPEDMVTFETTYYRPRTPYVPKWNIEIHQEIEQLIVEKYGGHLHWGKSGGHLFDGQAMNKTVSLAKFMEVKKRFDPHGYFSNDWTDRVLGINGKKVEVLGEKCAFEKVCKCRVDSHCDPNLGYFCRPGRVWTNARVCRKE